MDNLLTYDEAAQRLRMNRKQLKYYIKTRHIPYVKLGERKRLIKESDLEKFIKDNLYQKK